MELDWIVVALFLIAVAYVINRAISSIEQQTEIKFQKADFEKQLSEKTLGERTLKEILDINFRFQPSRYKFDFHDAKLDEQPKSLVMLVINKSQDVNIYLDWDKSSVTNYANTSRRLIRLNMNEQLSASSLPLGTQVPSPVGPSNTMPTRITGEDLLELKTDERTGGKYLQPNAPILSLYRLQQDIENKKQIPKEVREKREKQKLDFEDWKPLEFSVRLILRMADFSQTPISEHQYSFWLKFHVQRVLWRHVLPWNPKK